MKRLLALLSLLLLLTVPVSTVGRKWGSGLRFSARSETAENGWFLAEGSLYITSDEAWAARGWAARDVISVTVSDGVTYVPDNAFEGCPNLARVTLPASVTAVGEGAFDDCASLREIAVSSDNPAYASADGVLYDKAMTRLLRCPAGYAGRLTVPAGVREIAERAFANCASLTHCWLPDTLKTIGKHAFLCCGLEYISIPASVQTVGGYAFANCTKLTGAYIASGVTALGDGMFSVCTALNSVTLPDTLTVLGDSCFMGCAALKKVLLPPSVTEIGALAFANSGLTAINVPPACEVDPSAFDGCAAKVTRATYTLENGVLTVYSDEAWENMGWREPFDEFYFNVTSVIIAEGVKTVGREAFAGFVTLKSVQLPASLESIGEGAFYNCNLTEIHIPAGVKEIAASAFSFGLPVPVMGMSTLNYNNAVAHCASLRAFTVSPENPCFTAVDGVLFNKNKTVLVRYPAGKTATAYTVPDTVREIGADAFWGCKTLTAVTLPDSLEVIGADAFHECQALAELNFPNSVKRIENGAFYYCFHLQDIAAPRGCEVAASAFVGCGTDKWWTLKDGVLTIYSDNAWYYKVWDTEKVRAAVLTEGVTQIPNDLGPISAPAFDGCKALTSVTVPASVTNIGEKAFAGCEALENITVSPDNPNYSSEYGVLFNKDKTKRIFLAP